MESLSLLILRINSSIPRLCNFDGSSRSQMLSDGDISVFTEKCIVCNVVDQLFDLGSYLIIDFLGGRLSFFEVSV